MKRTFLFVGVLAWAMIALLGCKSNWPMSKLALTKPNEVETHRKSNNAEPDYITVQHCLIGFRGSVPGKPISRSQEEAQALATQLLSEARAGANFEEIIRKNTNDSPPGIYKMANFGKLAFGKGTFERESMVPAFGKTGFPLQVGEFGLAEYDSKDSPFGWHIIKRIE